MPEPLAEHIYVEQDPETNEKRWYSTRGMGVEYVRADRFAASHVRRDEEMMFLVERIGKMAAALAEIAKGEGAFSRDPLTHATNCIESMKQIARDALAYDDSPTDPHHGGKIWEER
jgi:hypothetical protein